MNYIALIVERNSSRPDERANNNDSIALSGSVLRTVYGIVLVFCWVTHEADGPGCLLNFLRKSNFAVFID